MGHASRSRRTSFIQVVFDSKTQSFIVMRPTCLPCSFRENYKLSMAAATSPPRYTPTWKAHSTTKGPRSHTVSQTKIQALCKGRLATANNLSVASKVHIDNIKATK